MSTSSSVKNLNGDSKNVANTKLNKKASPLKSNKFNIPVRRILQLDGGEMSARSNASKNSIDS